CDCGEPFDAGIAVAARRDELLDLLLAQSLDLAEAEAHRMAVVRGSLKRAVPQAVIDVRFPHLDAMLARIANELSGLVEAHRLAVEDGGAEDVRIMALDPRRGVDQEREACGVALGKAVFAEAFDLAEAALGEVGRIPA